MTDLTDLILAARRAGAAADPAAELARLQREVAASAADVLGWLPGAGVDEQVLHAEPALTLLRVEIAPRTEYPPHDHLIPACVAVLRGSETNTFHRADGGRLAVVGETETAAGAVLPMDAHVIHSVANRTGGRSVALHVYLGDLFGLSRTIWDPATGEPGPYSDERYFALARTTAPA
ncbi:hypothetical protein VSH64_46695 [Amycolatopsis rhabdoformis]|uniref:Cysteine dioxygenase n=1 Tax=Amycolatopsis rhabdoformis TaxID=1448059 RepID=A0ABZ1I881_9PSEU|nr:hypothetical protein [Amycolatopsis rhabdoformis]WSE30201.1 hypothetical protein VSH64_46695 [Amycolatopsis rhabdoformis]